MRTRSRRDCRFGKEPRAARDRYGTRQAAYFTVGPVTVAQVLLGVAAGALTGTLLRRTWPTLIAAPVVTWLLVRTRLRVTPPPEPVPLKGERPWIAAVSFITRTRLLPGFGPGQVVDRSGGRRPPGVGHAGSSGAAAWSSARVTP
ncbi:hypothetical protein [Streptomyces sp. NPDC001980]|uniref:hypothetical protein n=1 Tax=Streptomyces sp. NPDC001980 TaxID=3157126 RepID=UPI00332E2529